MNTLFEHMEKIRDQASVRYCSELEDVNDEVDCLDLDDEEEVEQDEDEDASRRYCEYTMNDLGMSERDFW